MKRLSWLVCIFCLFFVFSCSSGGSGSPGDGDTSDGDEIPPDADLSDGDGDAVEGEEDSPLADPCNPNPCTEEHRSFCTIDGKGGYICVCDEDYRDYGDRICKPAFPCQDETECAGAHRECLNANGAPLCGLCLAGYHEVNHVCEADVACEPTTCSGRGACDDAGGIPTCACETGYVGDHCEDCDAAAGWHWNAAGDACTQDPCDPNLCATMEHRVCEPATGACLCELTFCDIGGACVAAGASDPEHGCQYCNPLNDPSQWSLRGADYECRPTGGSCDRAEFCDGTGADCPADEKFGPEEECRAAAAICDAAEVCDGEHNDCPADVLSTQACQDGDPCTARDRCDGLGAGAEHCAGEVYDCHDHGVCNDYDDVCTCDPTWGGDYCDRCAEGFHDVEGQCITDGFVPIAAGSFWMGSPEDEPGNIAWEEARHYVVLTRPFEVMTHEATQAEYETLIGFNTSCHGPLGEPYGVGECGPDCPVEGVNWYDALFYANELSLGHGIQPCYVFENVQCFGSDAVPGVDPWECYDPALEFTGIKRADVSLVGVDSVYECEGYRLPTEAEWEYATRAGTETALYSGPLTSLHPLDPPDPNLDRIGWFVQNAVADYGGVSDCKSIFGEGVTCGPHPVGLKEPNAWGLYDTIGNVWELVWDPYQRQYDLTTPEDPAIDPFGADYWDVVRRGGAFDSMANYCRSASRGGVHFDPSSSYCNQGFRLVRTLTGR